MPLLCCDPDSVDGETSGFGTPSNHDLFSGSFSKESLLVMYFFIQKRFIYTWLPYNTHESICDVMHSQHWSQ